ncbi:MAG: amidohydrolase [Rhodospirillaceae bacterium]|nr:amidohydrolase [Rhodospirillaceae bacterium]
MDGKIGLEEHFAIADTLQDSAGFLPPADWAELSGRLVDPEERRLREMDANGMETMVLSLNAPAVQAIPAVTRAAEVARRANDDLAEKVARRPDRFQGLAALPLQDPELASAELTRCIRELGFVGVLANGFSQVEGDDTLFYYDLPQYRPFWAVCTGLGVPFYLHPRNPLPRDARIYDGHPWLMGPGWAFGQETAVHALRLMGSGLFDDHPELQIIVGHMGEGLPFNIWRVDNKNAWTKRPGSSGPQPARKSFTDYFRENFHITVSGNYCTEALNCSIQVIGADRILFSTDWPFENVDYSAAWMDSVDIAEADRLKIGRTNALRLFNLGG